MWCDECVVCKKIENLQKTKTKTKTKKILSTFCFHSHQYLIELPYYVRQLPLNAVFFSCQNIRIQKTKPVRSWMETHTVTDYVCISILTGKHIEGCGYVVKRHFQ
jgi:hypothetical protein